MKNVKLCPPAKICSYPVFIACTRYTFYWCDLSHSTLVYCCSTDEVVEVPLPKEGMEFISEFPPTEPTQRIAVKGKPAKPAPPPPAQVAPKEQKEVKVAPVPRRSQEAEEPEPVSQTVREDRKEPREEMEAVVEPIAPLPTISQPIPPAPVPSLYDDTIPPPKETRDVWDQKQIVAVPSSTPSKVEAPKEAAVSKDIHEAAPDKMEVGKVEGVVQGEDVRPKEGLLLHQVPKVAGDAKAEQTEPKAETPADKMEVETEARAPTSKEVAVKPDVSELLPEAPSVLRVAETGEEERDGLESGPLPTETVETPVKEAPRAEEGDGKEEEGEILSSSPVPEEKEQKQEPAVERYVYMEEHTLHTHTHTCMHTHTHARTHTHTYLHTHTHTCTHTRTHTHTHTHVSHVLVCRQYMYVHVSKIGPKQGRKIFKVREVQVNTIT